MKTVSKLIAAILVVAVAATSFGAVAISNVKIQQRYPWNGKVDISFNLASTRTSNAVRICAVDSQSGSALSVATLYDDNGNRVIQPLNAHVGTNRFVWDAAQDVVSGFDSDKVAMSLTAGSFVNHQLYCVVDLTNNCSISYLDDVPNGGWTDEYKKTKMVMRLIQPGVFTEGPNNDIAAADGYSRQVTITKPFYFSVFAVTKSQWNVIMGSHANGVTATTDRMCPCWYEIRGQQLGYNWPLTSEVDDDTFMFELRRKSGVSDFDLPTEAQWEYAARAGIPNGANEHAESPNPWGIYELGRNRLEWSIDWSCYNFGVDPVIDPKGPTRTYAMFDGYHTVRGGNGNSGSLNCRSPYVDREDRIGFRVVIQLQD